VVACEHVVAGDHAVQVVAAGSEPRERVGEHGPTEASRQLDDRRRTETGGLRAGNDDPSATGDESGETCQLGVVQDRDTAAACLGERYAWVACASGIQGDQRLVEGQIEVHRAGRLGDRHRDRRCGARDRCGRDRIDDADARHLQIARVLDVGAEQVDLVDRLGGPGVAQLRRPVCGQENEWHAREVGLDGGGQEVCRRGPRGADERDRLTELSRDAEREEARRSLVEVEPGANRAVVQRQRRRERCVA
jgi:hypothetical protein